MKRKIKPGYYCCYDYYSNSSDRVHGMCTFNTKQAQIILDSNCTKDCDGETVVDVRFYTPNNDPCTLEEAIEIPPLDLTVGNFYRMYDGEVLKLICDRKKVIPGYSGYNQFILLNRDGYVVARNLNRLQEQVKNWDGDPI